MPIEWLLIWGVTQATGALVKPVLEAFAEDVVKDSAKDYVKSCFGSAFKPLQKDAHAKALGKALKELVQLIDAELRNTGVPEAQTEAWTGDVKQFIRTKGMQEALRQAFNSSNSVVDSALLKQGWRQLPEPSPLPRDFDWDYIAKAFGRRLRSLREEDSDLRQILQTQAAVETAAHTRQALGVQPDFHLQSYREALLERYAKLQHLALQWARIENAAEREALPLPLLIEFKEYDRWDCPNSKNFARYLHDAQNWHRLDQVQLDERLRDGRQPTLLLLDGLDEIFDLNRRSQVINDIQYFSNQYPQVRVIVTSRVIGYKPQRLADAEFRHFLLQDLDERQINDFLDRWHDTTFSDARDRAAKKARLARAISDSPAIRELAGNPLLLTMMAILNRNQELPRERIQLYEQASRLLLHQWDTERALDSHPQLKGHVGPKEKSEMLREIAYAMQSAPEGLAGNLISEDELEAMLSRYLKEELGFGQPRAAARDLIAQLRLRNFILCYRGGGSYSFVHRTFLEYFCATAIMQYFRRKLTVDFLKDIYGRHWNDESWHEVLCLIAGMVGDSSGEQVAKLIEFLLEQWDESPAPAFQNVFLAARCFQEVRNPKSLTTSRNRIISALNDLLKFDFSSHFGLPHALNTGLHNIRKAVRHLSKLQLLNDPYTWLKDRTINDENWAVREAAVLALIDGWGGNPNALSFLKQCAIQEYDPIVQEVIVSAVARSLKEHPDTLPWLKERAAKDDNWAVRQAAVQELTRGWKDDPDILPLLKDRAVNDPSPDAGMGEWRGGMRHTAIENIARDWPNDPGTLPLLRERAENDPTPWLREKARQFAAEIEARRENQ